MLRPFKLPICNHRSQVVKVVEKEGLELLLIVSFDCLKVYRYIFSEKLQGGCEILLYTKGRHEKVSKIICLYKPREQMFIFNLKSCEFISVLQ